MYVGRSVTSLIQSGSNHFEIFFGGKGFGRKNTQVQTRKGKETKMTASKTTMVIIEEEDRLNYITIWKKQYGKNLRTKSRRHHVMKQLPPQYPRAIEISQNNPSLYHRKYI